jgi:hypothetical protein
MQIFMTGIVVCLSLIKTGTFRQTLANVPTTELRRNLFSCAVAACGGVLMGQAGGMQTRLKAGE